MIRRIVLGGTAIWVLLAVSLWASGWKPSVISLAGIIAVITALGAVTVRLAIAAPLVRWPERKEWAAPSKEDKRVTSFVGSMQWSDWNDTTKTRDTLIQILDDRLLERHGIDRHANAEAAERSLTPSLRRLVGEPTRRLARASELRAILTDLEAL